MACGAGASINDLHTGDFRPDFLLQRVMGRPTLCFLPEGPFLEANYEGLKAGMEKAHGFLRVGGSLSPRTVFR